MIFQVAIGLVVGVALLKTLRKGFAGTTIANIVGANGTYQAGGRTQAVNGGVDVSQPPNGAVPPVQGNESPQVSYDNGYDEVGGYDSLQ